MAMQTTPVLEGTLEEITAEHPELLHKRVRVIVLPELSPQAEPELQPTLYERLKPWIGCIDAPDAPHADTVKETFADILTEKHEHADK